MLLICIFLAVCLMALSSVGEAAAEFNIFKSYADAKVKPPQYSANSGRKKHHISEYLNGKQEMMMKLRKMDNPAGYTFTENWSGFDPEANAKITPLRRRLSVVAPLTWIKSATKSSSIMSYGIVMVLVVFGFASYKQYASADKMALVVEGGEIDINEIKTDESEETV